MNNLNTTVDIVATLAVPQSWSKSFDLLQTQKNGNLTLYFPIDIASYTQLYQSINSETGVSPQSYNLTLTANIHTTGETQYGPINEKFSTTMTGTIAGNVLMWDKNLTDSKTGAINQTTTLDNPNKYFGLSVSAAKTLFVVLSCIFIIFFVSLTVLYLGRRVRNTSTSNRQVQNIQKRYGARVTESTSDSFTEGEKPVFMNSMEDLIKVADELGKPVVHQSGGSSEEVQSYFVIDGYTRYQYSLLKDTHNREVDGKED